MWLADSDESDNHTTESGATFNIEFLVNKKKPELMWGIVFHFSFSRKTLLISNLRAKTTNQLHIYHNA